MFESHEISEYCKGSRIINMMLLDSLYSPAISYLKQASKAHR